MKRPLRIDCVLFAAVLLFCTAAQALEFRSVNETGTVFHAAPTTAAARLFVVSQFYPVEIVDENTDWARVRDVAGQLGWVPTGKLSRKRYVVIAVPRGVLRSAAQDAAATLLTLERNVVLELLEPPSSTWVKVRHDGKTTGFVRLQDIWGI